MRPVEKSAWPQVGAANKSYNPHTIAKPDLEDNIGTYCSYCEVYSSDLEVEHVISQHQDNTLTHNWNNFLLACGRCNGKNNKSNQAVDLAGMHFPHRNNTMISFEYLEGGLVQVNPLLTGNSKAHAEATLKLVGLDKRPGHPKYSLNDRRWTDRRVAWELAKKYLVDFESGNGLTAEHIVAFATQRGFFSVWFSVFKNHDNIKELLVNAFQGTANNCFDAANHYSLSNRNPGDAIDEV